MAHFHNYGLGYGGYGGGLGGGYGGGFGRVFGGGYNWPAVPPSYGYGLYRYRPWPPYYYGPTVYGGPWGVGGGGIYRPRRRYIW